MLERSAITASLAAVVCGCAPTFDDRHDLLGFRIAAVGVVDGEASAAVWSGSVFHAESVTLHWSADGEPLGLGWGVPVPPGTGELGLRVVAPDGQERTARVSVSDGIGPLAFERTLVSVGDDVSIDGRSALEERPLAGSASDGEAVRIRLVDPGGTSTRWMVGSGATTLLELDSDTVDVLPDRLTFDDGEVVGRVPAEVDVAHVLALRMDGAGGNRWVWVDAPIAGDHSVFRSDGWVLEGAVDVSTGLLAVTLDGLEAGGVGALGDPEPVLDLEQHDPPACAPSGQPFSLDWLANGRCSVSETRGRRVVVAVD